MKAARKPPQSMSAKGRAFLAREEGCIPYAYNDPLGYATFGVGHLIGKRPVTWHDRIRYGTPAHPRKRLAQIVFKRDLKVYEAAVRRAVGRELYQHRFDACVSLCFNIGTGGFAGSSVARLIRGRRSYAAADAFLNWSNPGILRPRRRRERRLFLTGQYH